MATLKDIARVSGVHPTTVSSILNAASGNSRFSEATRRKVEQAAKRLGYARDYIARSLRTRKTRTVGLVAGNIQNPFFAALSLQLEAQLRTLGYDLVLTCHGADSAQDESDLAQTLVARSVDGLLIWSEQRDGQTSRLPKGSTTPCVWMGNAPRGEIAVSIDIAHGIELALRYVCSLGCRRLGYYAPAYAQFAGLPKSRPDILDEVCRKLAMSPPVHLFFPGQSWNLRAAVEYAFPLLNVAKQKQLDAVLAYNDVSAVGWHIASRERKHSWPVIGFDGSPLVKAWRPAIAHVDLHSDILGMTAVNLLCAMMKGESPSSKRTFVHPTFVAAAE
jgi:LacI family transcriptional regulator